MSHLTVVIGASAVAEELRRSLVSQGVIHAGIATHLRGLREMIVLGDSDLVVICIALDRATLQRHGETLRQLLADHHCFPQAIRSVGLLNDMGLTSEIAEMGCDIFVHDSTQAIQAIDLLTKRWELQRAKQQLETNRLAACQCERNTWVWGLKGFPAELSTLISNDSAQHGSGGGAAGSS